MAVKNKKPELEQEDKSLEVIIAEVNKKFGKGTLGRLGDYEEITGAKLVTGIKKFDTDLGGGLPLGKMVQMYGLQGSGKSMIAQRVVADAQRRGLEAVWFDTEHSFNPEWARLLGVDTDKLIFSDEGQVEDVFDAIRSILPTNPGIIVIDSVASMKTHAEMTNEFDQNTIALMARFLSRALPVINQLNKQTCILFLNQLRTNITAMGAFGNTIPGGRALGFTCSQMIEIKRDSDLIHVDNKKANEVIGQKIQYNITKNRFNAPFKNGSFKFFYDGSIVE
jgi:recombination protein RecA